MGDSSDNDSIQLNTIDQSEYSLKLAKKKQKIKENNNNNNKKIGVNKAVSIFLGEI
jgi:hypothetical protein